MKILAIDSSSLTASVAVVEDDLTIAEYTVNYKKTHSETLLPMLDEIVKMTNQDLSTVDGIALAAGPGSFTGLRIGSATAKGLAEALNKPVIAVPTVDGLAANLYGVSALVCPVMDARRNQTYTGIYEFVRSDGCAAVAYEMKTLMPQAAMDLKDLIQKLNEMGREVIFLGDGVPVFKAQFEEELKVPFSFAPNSCNRQRAAVIGMLGKRLLQEGKFTDAKAHAPEYLRLSQAERERMEKNS